MLFRMRVVQPCRLLALPVPLLHQPLSGCRFSWICVYGTPLDVPLVVYLCAYPCLPATAHSALARQAILSHCLPSFLRHLLCLLQAA